MCNDFGNHIPYSDYLAAFSDKPGLSAYDAVRNRLKAANPNVDFEKFWRKTLNDGVVANTTYPALNVTPKFNAAAGRDHWGNVFSLALAGGGIRGGVVHGVSDRHAAFPVDGMVTPPDTRLVTVNTSLASSHSRHG